MSEQIKLVGVLNVTPDSFSDAGRYMEPELAYKRALEMFDEGADIIDIGAEATNPNAEPISVREEWRRLKPIVERVLPEFNNKISIDTHHPEIVERVSRYGQFVVNDVTTFQNPGMIKMAARYNLLCIASHLPFAAEQDIKFAHDYLAMNNLEQIRDELLHQRSQMIGGNIQERNIILDPGIGFGKDMVRNWGALEFAKIMPTLPLMIAYSCKQFLATDPQSGRLNHEVDRYDIEVNLAAAEIAIAAAEKYHNLLYLRVHDVAPHRALIDSRTPTQKLVALQGHNID